MIQRPTFLPIALVLLVTACSTEPPTEDQSRLASACQLTKCRCVAEQTSVFRVAATDTVKWQRDGAAFCDPGFHLERVVEERRPGY
jgi:hypothetical protein